MRNPFSGKRPAESEELQASPSRHNGRADSSDYASSIILPDEPSSPIRQQELMGLFLKARDMEPSQIAKSIESRTAQGTNLISYLYHNDDHNDSEKAIMIMTHLKPKQAAGMFEVMLRKKIDGPEAMSAVHVFDGLMTKHLECAAAIIDKMDIASLAVLLPLIQKQPQGWQDCVKIIVHMKPALTTSVFEYMSTHGKETEALYMLRVVAEQRPKFAAAIADEMNAVSLAKMLDHMKDYMEYIRRDIARDIIAHMNPNRAAETCNKIDREMLVDLFSAMEQEAVDKVIKRMDPVKRADLSGARGARKFGVVRGPIPENLDPFEVACAMSTMDGETAFKELTKMKRDRRIEVMLHIQQWNIEEKFRDIDPKKIGAIFEEVAERDSKHAFYLLERMYRDCITSADKEHIADIMNAISLEKFLPEFQSRHSQMIADILQHSPQQKALSLFGAMMKGMDSDLLYRVVENLHGMSKDDADLLATRLEGRLNMIEEIESAGPMKRWGLRTIEHFRNDRLYKLGGATAVTLVGSAFDTTIVVEQQHMINANVWAAYIADTLGLFVLAQGFYRFAHNHTVSKKVPFIGDDKLGNAANTFLLLYSIAWGAIGSLSQYVIVPSILKILSKM